MFSYLKGVKDVFGSIGIIFSKGIRGYVIVPLIINIGLFSTAIVMLSDQMQVWLEKLLPSWLSWLEWLILPLFVLTLLVAVFYTFTIVANLIAAPFNSLLSSSIEAKLTGSKPVDMSAEKLVKLVLRTMGSEISKLLYFLLWLIPVLLITVIPVINVVAPFAWFLYAAWSFAIEYTDYPLGNRGKLFREIKQYNKQHRMRTLGLGSGVFVMTSIPVLNFIAMPVAVAAATRLVVDKGAE